MNLPTIIVSVVIAAVFVAIVVHEISARKKGKCSCGCSQCSMSDLCHKKK